MPSPEECWRCLDGIAPWLPVLLALSANSPWFEGRRTGLLSTRAEILALLPRHGAPPRFASWREWEALVATFTEAGVVDDYGGLHWDVRPHPRFGTLEIRVADQPTTLERTRSFVEVVRAFAAWALEQPDAAGRPGDRAVYDQNRFAAARFGPRATLIHPERDEGVPAVDLYDELTARTGCRALDPEYCEADDQLAFADPLDATADVVRRSLQSPA
jgi:carboxylate-amine ligase